MRIIYGKHAREKLSILKAHGLNITEELVADTLLHADEVVVGLRGRLIAQKVLNERHVLRVVYVKEENQIRVVTVYPARRERY